MAEQEAAYLKKNLDTTAETPLFRQIYMALRAAILNGEMGPGYRLLPSRALADRLEISRTTVTQAYRQLLAEGFTESLVGSGTRVCRSLPDAPTTPKPTRRRSASPPKERTLSRRGQEFRGEFELFAD